MVIACDYDATIHRLIRAQQLALMKRTAFFINTDRWRIVGEPALVKARQDGTIAGAGLDVLWNEPPVTYNPALSPDLYNVIPAP